MSNISSLINVTSGAIKNVVRNDAPAVSSGRTEDAGTFDGIYNAAVNMVTSTNNYLQDAQRAEVAFATGELTNTHELAVIEQKANLSLQYTVAIRDKILDAYKEIMNMQI